MIQFQQFVYVFHVHSETHFLSHRTQEKKNVFCACIINQFLNERSNYHNDQVGYAVFVSESLCIRTLKLKLLQLTLSSFKYSKAANENESIFAKYLFESMYFLEICNVFKHSHLNYFKGRNFHVFAVCGLFREFLPRNFSRSFNRA